MTNQDPYIPPGSPGRYDPPGTNPPRHQPSPRERSGSAAWIGAVILVLVLLAGGAYLWAAHGGRSGSGRHPPAPTRRPGGPPAKPRAGPNLPHPPPPPSNG